MSEYFFTLLATLISTYLSPIETTIPPMMDGSNLVVSKRVWPCLRNALRADSSLPLVSASSGLAVITSQTTSPRFAAMITLKAFITALIFWRRPFSARRASKFVVAGLRLALDPTACRASTLTLRLMVGSLINSASLTSVFSKPFTEKFKNQR